MYRGSFCVILQCRHVCTKSPYNSAPADSQVLLKKADEFIRKEQYESAFETLSKGSDEFVLAKKIEIAINLPDRRDRGNAGAMAGGDGK